MSPNSIHITLSLKSPSSCMDSWELRDVLQNHEFGLKEESMAVVQDQVL